MQAIITENREKIAELCRTHHVRRLSVFGSAVRDDFDAERSDVDLLVEFEPALEQGYARNFFNLLECFDDLFGRKVDLVTEKYVVNPYLRKSIQADKVTLYAARPATLSSGHPHSMRRYPAIPCRCHLRRI